MLICQLTFMLIWSRGLHTDLLAWSSWWCGHVVFMLIRFRWSPCRTGYDIFSVADLATSSSRSGHVVFIFICSCCLYADLITWSLWWSSHMIFMMVSQRDLHTDLVTWLGLMVWRTYVNIICHHPFPVEVSYNLFSSFFNTLHSFTAFF
jgi:hypothetical protein